MPRAKNTPLKDAAAIKPRDGPVKPAALPEPDSDSEDSVVPPVAEDAAKPPKITYGKVRGKKPHHGTVALGKGKKRTRAPGTAGTRKPHRWRPGTVALREIRSMQKNTDHVIPRLSFQRYVREVAQKFSSDMRWKRDALEALQEGAEAHLVNVLEGAYLSTMSHRRVTLSKADMDLCRRLRATA